MLGLGIFAGLVSCGSEDTSRDRDRDDAGSGGTRTAGSSGSAGSAGRNPTGGDTATGGKGSSGTSGSDAGGSSA
ncbi:MAG TPA: hypothetical protein VGK73_24090, partial [Polyangiaceae bacterium]